MKNIIKYFTILCAGLLLGSCAFNIVDLTGDISGTVKDYDSGQMLGNCKVSLSPGGKSLSTDASGSFSFEDLEMGVYTLSVSKSEYADETVEVAVITGQTTKVDVHLKPLSATTGAITGTIKDYAGGQLISGCKVSISPGGNTVVSSSSGTYEFTSLNPGDYSLTFSKSGYDDETLTVSIAAGRTSTADVLMKSKSPFTVSETNYDFGDLEVTKMFYFFNSTDTDCSFTISNIPEWLSFSQIEGVVKALGSETVTATVDRGKVAVGSWSQNITITYAGKTSGYVTLTVKMQKVELAPPTVTITSAATNIKQDSFDISGAITATGGSQITSYGHCWNTSGNPTVNDSHTDLGVSTAIGSFTSTASGLSTYTTYYVRAYAANAQGISYSDQIAVTTQDVERDVWDGNIASEFAGGSGTSIDPYVIKTGGQLLLAAKNYSNKHFVLGGNIDLNNKNWLPCPFSGTLNGRGYTISNLYIDRLDSRQGLFSELRGTVSNLMIKQVVINAGSVDNVGAISGYCYGATITNCLVTLGEGSLILGNNSVGGICGFADCSSITKCIVQSTSSDYVIKGVINVGGIIGWSYNSLSECQAGVNILGETSVGGICGYVSGKLEQLYYVGNVKGNTGVGGIVGDSSTNSIVACKVWANVTASTQYAGGVDGMGGSSNYYCCYTFGTVNSAGSCGGIHGREGSSGYAYLCYSTMSSSSSTFYGLSGSSSFKATDCATTSARACGGTKTNTKTECTDITTFLKECYSQYASYWNFDNNWVWEGTIAGEAVRVNCPKLAWEK